MLSRYRVFNRGTIFSAVVISDVLTVPARDTDLLAVLADAVAHPGRLAVGVHDHHVGDVDRRLLGDDAAGLRTTLGLRDPGVLLDPVHALDEHALAVRVGLDDLALGALVLARDDNDRVALLDLHVRAPPEPAR